MFRIEIHDFSAGHCHSDCFFDERTEKDNMSEYINEQIGNYINEWGYRLIDFGINIDEYGSPILRLVFKRPSKLAMIVDDTAEIFIRKIVTNKEYCYEC